MSEPDDREKTGAELPVTGDEPRRSRLIVESLEVTVRP